MNWTRKLKEVPVPTVPKVYDEKIKKNEKNIQNLPNIKKTEDITQVILSAVERNWIQQPQTTENQDIHCTFSSSRTKKEEDDLCKGILDEECCSDEFLFLETTLPQERPGIISITPSHSRIHDCKVASIKRPRSLSPETPVGMADFIQAPLFSEKIQVKLPSYDRTLKPKPRHESRESFSEKGLQTFKISKEKKNFEKKQPWINFDFEEENNSKCQIPPNPPKRTFASLSKKK